ncbi:MAG: CPBP family intramembrane glutamic endopeptidase [Myxococcaceae bacterium]
MTSTTSPQAIAAKKPVWPVFVGFSVVTTGMMIVSIAAVFLAAVIAAVNGESVEFQDEAQLMAWVRSVPWLHIVGVGTSGSLLLVTTLLFVRLEKQTIRLRLRHHPGPNWPLASVLATIAVLGMGFAMDSLAWMTGAIQSSALLAFSKFVATASTGVYGVLFVLAAGVAPLAEEFFFRGYAQSRLAERWGRWTGILVTASLFGLLHGDVLHSPMAFLMGLVFGYVAEAFGTLYPAIIAHAVNNATAMLLGRVMPNDTLSTGTLGALGLAGALVGAVALAALVALARRNAPPVEFVPAVDAQVGGPGF